MSHNRCLSDADLIRLWKDDLDARERQAFEQHMHACELCRQRFERIAASAVDSVGGLAAKSRQAPDCPSDTTLMQFASQSLTVEDQDAVAAHMPDCPRCIDRLAGIFCRDFERNGQRWWREFCQQQVFGLLIQLPQLEIESLLDCGDSWMKASIQPETIIQLPLFKRPDANIKTLAADSGEGLLKQKFSQKDPDFAVEVVQVGRQLRISATSTDLAYANCLARLTLLSAGTRRWSCIVLMEDSHCTCILEPETVKTIDLSDGDVALRIDPLQSADALREAGTEAYVPILTKLLQHKDAGIRCGAIDVLTRICGQEAQRWIVPLAEDEDADVRSAARRALHRWPWQR